MMDQRVSTNSIFIFIFAFLAAVLVSSFFSIPLYLAVLIFIVGVAILLVQKEVLFLSLALIAFSLGVLRYDLKDYHEEIVPSMQGIVISESESKENSTSFVMRSDNGEKVLISTDLYSPVEYGDEITVKGKLKEPGIIDDGLGRPFDYAKYLSKDDIYHTISFAKVEIVSHGHGNFIREVLFKIKNNFIGKIREILPEPESSLLAGLVVAGKGAMPKDILEEFRRSGVVHIVVLSGYNITIIAEFIRTVFKSAKFSILGVLLFVIMTGAPATVVRAAIMVLAVILAKVLRRDFSAPRALLAAGFLMIVHNPKILVFDPSFQLSFLATCGLIYISPIVEKFLVGQRMRETWGIRTILATTIATQTTVLPFLIYSVGDVSLVSLPANLLILPFIPVTMLVGFISTILAYLSNIVALPVAYITHLLLSWVLGVAHSLGNLSFATLPVPAFSFWIILAFYLGLFIWLKRSQGSPQHSSSLD